MNKKDTYNVRTEYRTYPALEAELSSIEYDKKKLVKATITYKEYPFGHRLAPRRWWLSITYRRS